MKLRTVSLAVALAGAALAAHAQTAEGQAAPVVAVGQATNVNMSCVLNRNTADLKKMQIAVSRVDTKEVDACVPGAKLRIKLFNHGPDLALSLCNASKPIMTNAVTENATGFVDQIVTCVFEGVPPGLVVEGLAVVNGRPS